MRVNILNLQNLFFAPVRYEIPPYQRRYVWDQEEQWDPLWEDVRNTAEGYLDNKEPQNAHFLGAVVIQSQTQLPGSLQRWLVVDGQQRLTTMQLLLDAVEEVFKSRGHSNAAARLEFLVLNSAAHIGNDKDAAFKVWPTLGDQDAFRQTMHNHLPSEEFRESLIVRAHEFFKLQVTQWLDENSDQTEERRADALSDVVTQLLNLVAISIEDDEDPHVIFETLNARGTPLLQSDLVKNLLLYESSQVECTDNMPIWDFDSEWWNEEVFQGRLLRPRVDAFLNFWLAMRKQSEVAHNDVFAVFRRYYGQEGKSDVKSVAADIRRASEAYSALEKKEVSNEMKPFLNQIGVMRVGVITPVLMRLVMWLHSSKIRDEQMAKSLLALESYLVRRMICGMGARSYNRLFIGMLPLLEEAGSARAGDSIVEYLRSQTAWATLWPEDQQLEDAFLHRPMYRLLTQGRTRIVLEGLELGLITNKAGSQSVSQDLTIEHIMPRRWRSHWKLPNNVEDEVKANSDRDHIIHTIGNLTLANPSLNSALSNAPWDKKRRTMLDHINLFLNKELVKETEWNEERIEARARQLSQVAVRVWPHADSI